MNEEEEKAHKILDLFNDLYDELEAQNSILHIHSNKSARIKIHKFRELIEETYQ